MNLEDPRFAAGLERLRKLAEAMERAKKRGGLFGFLARGACAAAAAAVFVRLYCLPALPNALPADVRLAPSW